MRICRLLPITVISSLLLLNSCDNKSTEQIVTELPSPDLLSADKDFKRLVEIQHDFVIQAATYWRKLDEQKIDSDIYFTSQVNKINLSEAVKAWGFKSEEEYIKIKQEHDQRYQSLITHYPALKSINTTQDKSLLANASRVIINKVSASARLSCISDYNDCIDDSFDNWQDRLGSCDSWGAWLSSLFSDETCTGRATRRLKTDVKRCGRRLDECD